MPDTSQGLATTLELLSKTENEAAVRPLVAALNSPYPTIRDGALVAILKRRSPAGHREIIRRLHTFDRHWLDLLREHRGRMRQAPRDAILDTDAQMCANGCRAALWLREYDLTPTLVNALEDPANPNADLVARTVLELIQELGAELSGAGGAPDRRQVRLARDRVLSALEASLGRFSRHRRQEVVEAFLLLAPRDNVTLKQILGSAHHPAFMTVVDVLSKSTAGGILRLLLSYLDDPHAPSAALSLIAKRSDLRFIRYLLRKIGRDPSALSVQNLKRIRTIGWLQTGPSLLEQLDEAAQHGVVRLVMNCGIPRLQAFDTIEHLVLHGKREGRRAAAAALAEFQGAAANAVALRALKDEDPRVQATILGQLRLRGIPGVLPRMVEMLDSQHAIVRKAAQRGLSEFTFARFLGALDMLDEEVRRSTGALVKKVDPETTAQLRAELQSKARTRRLRGLTIARTIDLVEPLESAIIDLLHDEDHLVRAEAALALAGGNSQTSLQALRAAETDRSETVRRAVEGSLGQREQFAQWRDRLADPRD